MTSGRRGDIVQCRAIAERLSSAIIEKEVAPRAPFRWIMPYGPIDPWERALIAPPYPDMIIASGRRTVPYVRVVVKKTEGKCRAVFMKYPGCDVSSLGLMWAPSHDKKSGPTIISTLTSPHLITPEKLDDRRKNCAPAIKALPGFKLGVLLGGNTRHVRYDKTTIDAFLAPLKTKLPFDALLVTGSRRTPSRLIEAIRQTTAGIPSFIWDGHGENPYFDIIANADAFLVTGDSHNLVSEALAGGKPVYVFDPPGNPEKFRWTLPKLTEKGLIMPHTAPLTAGATAPFDETPEIVSKIRQLLHE